MQRQTRFNSLMTEAVEDFLVNSLSQGSQATYGANDSLSDLLRWIRDAVVLHNREGLSTFLFETREAARKLSESNKRLGG